MVRLYIDDRLVAKCSSAFPSALTRIVSMYVKFDTTLCSIPIACFLCKEKLGNSAMTETHSSFVRL